MRYLVDVDGVVADLMGTTSGDGFARFFFEHTGQPLRPDLCTMHSISKSPAHAELHERFGLDKMISEYLSLPDVYQDYIVPLPGASRGIGRLLAAGHEVGFVTAIYGKAPMSYGSKKRWLDRYFPDVPMLTAPAETKGWVHGDRAIDDRYDTCQRWESEGTRSLLFRQPWNEAPPGTRSYDWWEIVEIMDAA